MGSPRETVVLAVAQATLMLACFPLRLHLSDGLMQPHEHLFSFPYLLPVSLSLIRSELNVCCVVRLTELGLPIVQDLADALRAGSGARYRGMSSHIAGRCARYHE